ncbi:MAG: hypothetical protein RLO17_11915 [Cyclobacteriaceae bacterium]
MICTKWLAYLESGGLKIGIYSDPLSGDAVRTSLRAIKVVFDRVSVRE